MGVNIGLAAPFVDLEVAQFAHPHQHKCQPAPVLPSPGATCSIYDGNKVYLGVRVKMPVRDLLKNIRLSQGGRHLEDQVGFFFYDFMTGQQLFLWWG